MAGTRQNLSAHAALLEEVAAETTVLPMRFGVILPDPGAVRDEILRSRYPLLDDLLEKLDGLVEVRIRALYTEDQPFREIAKSDRTVRELRDRIRSRGPDATYYDRIRLGEIVAQGLERARVHDQRTVVDRMSRLATDHVVHPPATERVASDVSFLVRRDRVKDLDGAAADMQGESEGRLKVRAAGPLPPWSFVDAQLGSTGRSPARTGGR